MPEQVEWRTYKHWVDREEQLRPTTFTCECGESVTAIPERSVNCPRCRAAHEIYLRPPDTSAI